MSGRRVATANFTVHGSDMNELIERAHALAAALAAGRSYVVKQLHATPSVTTGRGGVAVWEGDCDVDIYEGER